MTYIVRENNIQYTGFPQPEPTCERFYLLPSSMLWHRKPQIGDSGVQLQESGQGVGPVDFWQCIFMHMSSECIFRTYFRYLLMLVWLGQHFKRQILPFLTTAAYKALRVRKFLTISLNKWPLSPLKIPSSLPSPFAISPNASHLPAPTLLRWTPPIQQGHFHPVQKMSLVKVEPLSHRFMSRVFRRLLGTPWSLSQSCHIPQSGEGASRLMGKLWYIFRKRRANSEHKSVGRVSHGRRLAINTKESQNCELQPTSSSRGVSIQGCDSAKLLSQAIPYQSQVTTKTIYNNRPLLRWVISLPPWFFVTTILLSHKMLTRQETRKL